MENKSILSKIPLHYGWIVLATGTLVIFGSLGLARFGYTIVLPPMQAGLGLDNTQAGMIATANLVGYSLLSAIGGALASRLGPRIVIALGLTLAGITMLLTGLAESFLTAVIFRVFTGIGSGASNVPVMGLLSAWFAKSRRGTAAGIAVTGSSIAIIILGFIIPPILKSYEGDGWRVSWYLFGAVTIVLAVLSFIILRNRPHDIGMDAIGAEHATPPADQAGSKLEWGRVYKSPGVWQLGFIYVSFGFSYIIFMTFFTKHLIATGGYSSSEAGSLFSLMGFFGLFCGIWGYISDKIGRRNALIIVFAIHAVSFTMFGLWPVKTGFTVSAILFGISAWSIPAIMAAACGDKLGPRLAPAALGFITLLFAIGQAAGTSVAGILADMTGAFTSSFILAGAVALLGGVCSVFYASS